MESKSVWTSGCGGVKYCGIPVNVTSRGLRPVCGVQVCGVALNVRGSGFGLFAILLDPAD